MHNNICRWYLKAEAEARGWGWPRYQSIGSLSKVVWGILACYYIVKGMGKVRVCEMVICEVS